jgi:hypothetical protein
MTPDPIAVLQSIPGIGPYLPYVLLVAGGAALLMPWLPLPSRQISAYGVFYNVLNYLAQNFGNAQNAALPATSAAGKAA